MGTPGPEIKEPRPWFPAPWSDADRVILTARKHAGQGRTVTSTTGQRPLVSRSLWWRMWRQNAGEDASTACPERTAWKVAVARSALMAPRVKTDGRELGGSGVAGTTRFP